MKQTSAYTYFATAVMTLFFLGCGQPTGDPKTDEPITPDAQVQDDTKGWTPTTNLPDPD